MANRLFLASAALSLAFVAATAAGWARADAPDQGVYVSSAKLNSMVETTREGLITAPVPAGPGTTMLMVRRDRDGEVEVHTRLNDEFIVRAGHAIVRVGGRVEGNHQTAPGEFRGGTITGGHDYQLSPGDVLWIPAGAPHQTLVPRGGSFSYLALKFEAQNSR